MTPDDHGRIAARAVGTALIAAGLVTLIDFTICLHQSKQFLNKNGWTDYSPDGAISNDEPTTTFVHDTYQVGTPSVSPIGSGGFMLFGLAFFTFSRSIGRIIAGSTIKKTQSEQAGTGQPATRPVNEPEGGDKPQPEAEGRRP